MNIIQHSWNLNTYIFQVTMLLSSLPFPSVYVETFVQLKYYHGYKILK